MDAIPEPGKSPITRLIVEIAYVRGYAKVRYVGASGRSEAGDQ